MGKKTYHSSSVEETYALAKKIADTLTLPAVISLNGPLGAGKTHFVKGMALALGIDQEVTSPTFTLLHSYGSAEKRLHHCDFYRLKNAEEASYLGLEDYFSEGITVIEWGNKFPNLLPPSTFHISISPLSENEREFCYENSCS